MCLSTIEMSNQIRCNAISNLKSSMASVHFSPRILSQESVGSNLNSEISANFATLETRLPRPLARSAL